MMALSGQAWSGFWDPVQYTRVVFFFFFWPFVLSCPSPRFSSTSVYPFLLAFWALSLRAWFFNLVSFFLITSTGLSSLLTPSYTSFNALLLYLTLTMTGWDT